ncbi:MAG: hypothetical protein Q4G34_02240, partial [Micrococcus sp.]|nr:hypothetical protein [Micrococcus sp.]
AAQQGAAQRAAAEQGVARTVHGETADVETLDREKAAASIAAGRASSSEERAGAAAGMTTVPRPTYLDAPEMQRVITDTVTAPAKAPEGEVRLADGVSETHRARVRRAAQTNPNLDLDSVLARRRAS